MWEGLDLETEHVFAFETCTAKTLAMQPLRLNSTARGEDDCVV
jgi:hypothetical protein